LKGQFRYACLKGPVDRRDAAKPVFKRMDVSVLEQEELVERDTNNPYPSKDA